MTRDTDSQCGDTQALLGQSERNTPDTCRRCGGTGGGWYAEDPSPAGVSLGVGWYWFWEPCPECLDVGRCPRCGAKVDDEDRCLSCGWRVSSDPPY